MYSRNRLMITDSSTNSTYAQTYYGTSSDPEADLPMNFNLLDIGDPEGNGGTVTGRQIETHIKEWMDNMDDRKLAQLSGEWRHLQK